MIKEKNLNQKGISLITLTITVVILVILTNVIIYTVKDNLKIEKLKNMQNDIENLRNVVSSYYAQNGKIPINIKYTDIEKIKTEGVISDAVDTGDFYVIDLAAFDNLTLHYGTDFEKVKGLDGLTAEEKESKVLEYTDLYIINEDSHNIFYVEGIDIDGSMFYTDYTKDDIDQQRIDTSLRYVDGVKIPKGFYYVGGTKEEGLVISDVYSDDLDNSKNGNQFVWVPVEDINSFKTVDGYYNGALTTVLDSKCVEPYNEEETQEYNKMKESVELNKGFYIGRFETGKDNNGNAIVKKNATVYNKVTFDTAVEKARGFVEEKYTNNEVGVTSTLCYGVQWDATMQFFDNDYYTGTCLATSYVVDSTDRGNYGKSSPAVTGSNKAYIMKNIYDMAGNVEEWTMEYWKDACRVARGGQINNANSNARPASNRQQRSSKSNGSAVYTGFRIALYLDNEGWSPEYDKLETYEDRNGDIAYIPEGFKVSKKADENTILDGLVVQAPDGSEFVWVPVPIVIADSEESATSNKAMAINLNTGVENSEPQYRGLLYNFTGVSSEVISGCTTTDTENREPVDDTNIPNWEEEMMQNEYDAMIESVEKYKGFYVGRYETSIEGETVASKIATPMTAEDDNEQAWYGMYDKQKNYASNNENLKNVVTSSMIWGSQYDAIMNWILKGNDKTKVTATGTNHTLTITGETATDKMNNIYDLGSNLREWTLESSGANYRVNRGASYNETLISPSTRNDDKVSPSDTYNTNGSRLTLYIKNNDNV